RKPPPPPRCAMPAPAGRQQHKAFRRKVFIGFVLAMKLNSGRCSAATGAHRSESQGYHRSQMIYTCYEMVRDCRADLPEGWRHLIANYVPLIRTLLTPYAPGEAGDTALLHRMPVAIHKPESSLSQSPEPSPE